MNELQQILLSEAPLWITLSGYRQLMVAAFSSCKPATTASTPTQSAPVLAASAASAQPPTVTSFFFPEEKTYKQKCSEALAQLKIKQQSEGREVTLTDDFSSPELPERSIAYHRIFGPITAHSHWYFSTLQFERDIIDAEQNPNISAHVLHINSPGGEAWYLDRLGETLDACQKPIVAIYEQACSAAYHIACHAQLLYATTQFDFVGCIGTMTSFYDFEPYYAAMGIKLVEAKATQSDLKNKMFDDLRGGKPQQFIDQVLNPMNADFLQCVRTHRPKLASLPDDAPVLRGETFYTAAAIEQGLADGLRTFEQAIAETAELANKYANDKFVQDLVYSAV